MAATHHTNVQAEAFASAKSMHDLFNASGSGRVIRLYRAWIFNNQTGPVTGVVTTLVCRRLDTATPTGGSAVTPIKHDTNSSSLVAQVTAGRGRTVTAVVDGTLRRILWSGDEPAVSGATVDELQCLVPFAEIWNSGYGDGSVEPVVLRPVEGFDIQQPGANAVGVIDAEFEFTDSAT
jgi:hypothetical protein